MRVENAAFCRRVFFVRQNVFQFRVLFLPSGIVFVKRLRQTAPTDVSGQYFPFFRRCRSVLTVQAIDELYRFNVVSETLFRSAKF